MDSEVDIVRAVHDIADDIMAIMELEASLVQELLLLEDIPFDVGGLQTDVVVDALVDIIAKIVQLEEDEESILEGGHRERKERHLRVDIERFRTLGDSEFARHFRMNRTTFELLVLEFGNHLTATNRLLRLRTGLDVCLMMGLWILGNLSSFRGTGVVFGVSGSVVHFHYVVVIEALRELASKFIKWPSAAEKAHIKAACERRTKFPGIVGMMDGSLVKVTAPIVQAARYFDRHHNYSINVHLVCDHKLHLRHVYVGEPGGGHDAGIFARSPLYYDILERYDLVSNDEHILADSAYTLTNKVITPYRNNGHLNAVQSRFNFVHSSSRMPIEMCMCNGHWKEKWRRLYRLQVVNFDYAVDHIMSTRMLHNFVKLNGCESRGVQLPPRPIPVRNEDEVNEQERHPLLAAAKAQGVLKRNAIAVMLAQQ